MTEPLCLLTVHAHPDDEASKGAPTVAKYHAEGVRTVLVCCTGGEEGDINNPVLKEPGGVFHGLSDEEVRHRLADMRKSELAASAAIIGYDEVVMLGYRDSGMKDSPSNLNPECFARADFDDAVGRLVAVIRREKPQVIITYSDDQSGYPHPDHVMVHEISVPAFDRAADPTWYPEAGEPWRPDKLYYTVWSRARMLATHHKMLELGLESPFDEKWFQRPSQDHRVTTRIDIHDYFSVRRQALLAHETQIDPNEKFWFGLPDTTAREVYPWEDWVLTSSRVGKPAPGEMEDDLFVGVRTPVSR